MFKIKTDMVTLRKLTLDLSSYESIWQFAIQL